MKFHIVLPVSFSSSKGKPSNFGFGDTELGVKYRFLKQTDVLPDIAAFPVVELPTGDASKNLGNVKVQIYLPVWQQKDIGK